jgi:FixJ family two-component response regulator
MPGLNGTELIDELSRLEINIPVFVITAYGSSDLVKNLKDKEDIEYIDKPIDDEELLSRVKKLFESHTGNNQIFTQAH